MYRRMCRTSPVLGVSRIETSAWPSAGRKRTTYSAPYSVRAWAGTARPRPSNRVSRTIRRFMAPKYAPAGLNGSGPVLAPPLGEEDRGGGGDIEALHRAGTGNAQAQGRSTGQGRVHALALGAHDQQQPGRQGRAVQRLAAAHDGGGGDEAGRL